MHHCSLRGHERRYSCSSTYPLLFKKGTRSLYWLRLTPCDIPLWSSFLLSLIFIPAGGQTTTIIIVAQIIRLSVFIRFNSVLIQDTFGYSNSHLDWKLSQVFVVSVASAFQLGSLLLRASDLKKY